MNMKKAISISVLVGGILLAAVPQAHAQNASNLEGRLAVVEIKDASLKDALELIFKSAGVNSYLIDDTAAAVQIPDMVRQNISAGDLARQLVRNGDFILSRNAGDGVYTVKPRNPTPLGGEEGGFPGGFQGGFPGGGNFQGGGGFQRGGNQGGGRNNVPSNPFGSFGASTTGRPLITPKIEARANSQTRPRVPGAGGTTGTTTKGPTEFNFITIRHVYVGGIASLFANSEIITSEQFVSPEPSSNFGGGNNSGGGFGGGGGGFGGGVSSFGGNSGGGFGGGFGGNSGGGFGGNSGGGFGGGFR